MDNMNKKRLSKDLDYGTREHQVALLNNHHHIGRSLLITIGLLFFLVIMPPFIRTALFRGILAHRYLTSMLLCFSLIALSLLWSTGQQIDTWAFLCFNLRGKRPLWLDRLMLVFTQLGNGLAGLLSALILFWVDGHRLAYELILGTLTLWLVVELVKALIHRSRPFTKLNQTRIVGAIAHGCSFPSGHTSQIFFMATLLLQHFHFIFWAVISLYTLAMFVAVTRMYVGAHYPRDVLAGAILGSVWGILGVIVDKHF